MAVTSGQETREAGTGSGSRLAFPRRDRRLIGRAAAVVAMTAIVVTGIVLRFVASSPLWLDEALSVNIARLSLGDLPDALRHDGHPPLYYVLLHGWMALFGTGDAAVRALSGVFSVALLPLAWVAGRRLAGPAGGWAAVVVLAVNPYAVRYATEARMYSLVMVLALGLVLLLPEAADRVAAWRLIAIAAVVGALVLTHYWTIWLVAAVGLWLALHRRWRPLGAVIVGTLALVPWLGVLIDQIGHTGTPWSDPARPTRVFGDTLLHFGGGTYPEAALLMATLCVLFVLGLFAWPAMFGRGPELDVHTVPVARREAFLVVVTLAVGAFAGIAGDMTFHSRYASAVFPMFVVVAAVGLVRIPAGTPRVLVALALTALGLAGSVLAAVEDRTQAAEVASAIREGAGPDDVVVYCPDQLGPAVSRLLPDDLAQAVYPSGGPPQRVDWMDYAERNRAADPQQFVADVAAEHDGAVWLVMSPGYQTYEERCEALLQQFSVARGVPVPVVAEDPELYEHAALHRLAPAP